MDFKEFNAEQSVSATLDSLHLLQSLKLKPQLTADETNTFARNKKHIELMMAKPEFINALTPQQKTDLSLIIS